MSPAEYSRERALNSVKSRARSGFCPSPVRRRILALVNWLAARSQATGASTLSLRFLWALSLVACRNGAGLGPIGASPVFGAKSAGSVFLNGTRLGRGPACGLHIHRGWPAGGIFEWILTKFRHLCSKFSDVVDVQEKKKKFPETANVFLGHIWENKIVNTSPLTGGELLVIGTNFRKKFPKHLAEKLFPLNFYSILAIPRRAPSDSFLCLSPPEHMLSLFTLGTDTLTELDHWRSGIHVRPLGRHATLAARLERQHKAVDD